MSHLFEELELKFSTLDAKIENKIIFVNNFHDDQQKSINEHFDIKKLEIIAKKHSNEFNNFRESLLQVISTNLRLEIERVDELLRINGENPNFKISLELEKTKRLHFNRSIIKSETTCIMRLIMNEFKFGSKFSALQLIKYKDILGISEYLVQKDGIYDWDESLIKAFENPKLDFEIFRLLVDGGANINVKDNFNYHKSTMTELVNLCLTKYLVEDGTDVNAKNIYRWTALILASKNGHLEIVKYLVENGVDLNSNGGLDNETALMLASKNGHLEIVKCLVENGANLNAINKRNYTALVLAYKYKKFKIVNYLVKQGAAIQIQKVNLIKTDK